MRFTPKHKLIIATIFTTLPAWADGRLEYELEKKVGYAINACSAPLRHSDAGKSPAEAVSMSDYVKFEKNYTAAVAEKKDIASYEGKVYGKVVKDVLPRCKKLMDDYAAGKGAKNLPVSRTCDSNVRSRLKPILPGGSYHSRLSTVWYARKDLEAARYYMYRKEGGYYSGGATCEANDPHKKAFSEIKKLFKQAEAQVKAWEKERGVEFYRVEDGNKIIFKKDGKVLSATESNRV